MTTYRIGTTTIHHGDGQTVTVLGGGGEVRAPWAVQPGQAETAAQYGILVETMNRHHDLAHAILAHVLAWLTGKSDAGRRGVWTALAGVGEGGSCMSLLSVLRACCWRGLGRYRGTAVGAEAMTAPLFAGFEGARLHWNSLCTLTQTQHIPGMGMARHYADAIAKGAQGFRDTLPERFDPLERWTCARAEAPNALIVWSAVHFDQPRDPIGHAQRLARILGPRDRLICVNEPSVGPHVSGMTREDATMQAAAMMGAALAANPDLRFWTSDPAHVLPTTNGGQPTGWCDCSDHPSR